MCQSLETAPSGNTVREHLTAALDQSAEGLQQLEAQINQALIAQLPTRLRQELLVKAWEVARDWITIPYHGVVEEGETEVRGGQPKAGTSKLWLACWTRLDVWACASSAVTLTKPFAALKCSSFYADAACHTSFRFRNAAQKASRLCVRGAAGIAQATGSATPPVVTRPMS